MSTKLLTILSTLFFALSINQVNARTYYVNDASLVGDVYCKAIGNTMNDGLSPLKPKASLKQLYTAYNQFADGDTIYIDAGTYIPGSSSEDVGFSFTKSITIQGAGSNKTILDHGNKGFSGDYSFAKIQGSVTIKDLQLMNFFSEASGDIGQCLTFLSTGQQGARLSNVVISNRASLNTGFSAILILSNTNVILDGNLGGGVTCKGSDAGGGVDVIGTRINLSITNYSFINNSRSNTNSGTSISISKADSTTNISVSNSIFKSNSSNNYGAAIWSNSGILKLSDCIFESNKTSDFTGYNGGVLSFQGGKQTLVRCSFINNTSNSCRGTISNQIGVLSIKDCYFSGNKAARANDIYNVSGTTTIENTTFSSTGTNISKIGGSLTISNSGTPTQSGATIVNNVSPTVFASPIVPKMEGVCSTGLSISCPDTLEYPTYTTTCNTGILSPTTYSPAGGIFNTSEGLDLNKNTGEINYATSISGTYSITYFAGGCSVSKTLNFGAGSLSGNQAICEGTTTTFASTLAGGIWSSSNNGIASVNSAGLVTAIGLGTATIYYTVVGVQGCADAVSTRTVTITAKPIAGTISGTTTLCDGKTSQLTSNSPGGNWSISGSSSAIATIHPTSGLLSGVSVGSATVIYTVLGTGGCISATASTSIKINGAASVGVLSGAQTICLSGTNTFTSTVAGGTWSSGDPSIATINSSTGLITNIKAGTVTMTYTQAGVNGCPARTATQTLTITSSPSAGVISGNTSVCTGTSTTLTSNLLGGSWSSATTSVATINATTGVVTPVAAGSSVITYTMPTTGGCAAASVTKTINVITSPTIAGTTPASRCDAGTLTLGATASSGTISWYAASTGGVSLATGTSFTTPSISSTTTYYVEVTGVNCTSSNRTAVIATIIPTPTITGITDGTSCAAGTVTLRATASAGTINWYATLSGGTSLGTGNSFITPSISKTTTYYVDATNTNCTSSARTAVSANLSSNIPTIAGVSNVCVGSTTSLTGSSIPNASTPWTSSSPGIATINNAGIVNGLTAGTSVITYINSTGCTNTITVTVNAIDKAAFTYSQTSYCLTDANPIPTISGAKGGTFTFTPTGLMIDKITGAISLATSNTGSYTVTYTSNGNCPSSASTSISVGSTPVVDALADQSICAGAVSNEIKFTGSPGTVFTWVNSNTATGITSTGTGNMPAFIGSNSGNSPVTSVITVTPQSVTCVGTSKSFTLTVQPKNNANFTYPSNSFCKTLDNNPQSIILGEKGGVFTASPSGLNLNPSTGLIKLSSSAPGLYTIKYTTVNSCTNSDSMQITIGDNPAVNDITSQNQCIGTAFYAINFTGSPGSTFSWVNNTPSIGLAASGDGNIASFTGTGVSASTTSLTATITVTPLIGSCPGVKKSFTLTVQPKDIAQISYTSTQYCPSESDPIPVISGTTGGVFSATPTGLVIDANTGKISLANSSKGNYAVFYKTMGMCPSEMQWDINLGTTSSTNLSIVTSSGKNSFCVGDSLKLIAQGATKYLWNTGKKDNFITVKTPGKYTVSSNEGVCSNSVSLEISIDTVRVQMYIPSLVGFNNGSIILNGTPKEGTFSGIGVNNNTFDPKLAGLGVKKITFSYVSPNNCSAQASQNILVYDTVNTNCTVTKYDTLKVTKYDTVTYTNNVTKYDTVKVTKYDTVTFTNNVTKYDTVKVTKFDTVTVKNNVYDTVTITNNVTKYDTVLVNKTIYDTVTFKNNVYDTVTITNNVTKYDTLKVTKYDTLTIKNNVYDTVTITNNVTKYDTVLVTKYDTITLTDTVSILKIKFKLTTGIQANQMASMSLYPNPTSDVLHIEVGDAKALEGYRYRILDALGKEVYNELVKNTITEIPLKSLGAAGLYQFEVLDQNNSSIQTNKIVLQ
jgi:hypothetical protein